MSRLTIDQINATATAAGFEPQAVRAVLQVETGGSGYDRKTGWLLIQFEPAWFRRKLSTLLLERIRQAEQATSLLPVQVELLADWKATQSNGVEGQVQERKAFDAATRIDAHAAQLATSWGLPQMMGFNHAACGYKTVEAMVESFRQSEDCQLAAMLRFIKSKPVMANALKAKNWAIFAYYYNGAGYKQFNYDRRLAAAYASLS
jgi:hypothetical protein